VIAGWAVRTNQVLIRKIPAALTQHPPPSLLSPLLLLGLRLINLTTHGSPEKEALLAAKERSLAGEPTFAARSWLRRRTYARCLPIGAPPTAKPVED
jgi:hypothetical protein